MPDDPTPQPATTGPTPPPPPPGAAAGPPKPRRGGARLWLSAGLPVLGVALVAAGALWALATPEGARWTLGQVPGLTVQGLQGSWREGLRVERVQWTSGTAAAGTRVDLERLDIAPPSLALTANPQTWAALRIDRLRIGRVRVVSGGGSTGPAPRPPESLALPVELRIGAFSVDALSLPGLDEPVEALRGGLHLGAQEGSEHRLDELQARWRGLAVGAELRIGTAAPLPLSMRLQVDRAPPVSAPAAAGPPLPGPSGPWQARISAEGPLAGFDVQAQVAAAGQSLQAQARVAAFDAWPLPRLAVEAEGLDLSALWPALGATALSGRVTVQPEEPTSTSGPVPAGPQARDPSRQELAVRADLRNGRPARASDAGLPFSSLVLDARVDGRDPAAGVAVRSLRLQVADASGGAGALEGSGRWTPELAEARLRFETLRLQALDDRLPPLRLGGPVELRATGLDGPPLQQRLAFQADLSGVRLGATRGQDGVALRGRAEATWDSVALEELRLQAGAATAQGELRARRAGTSAPAPAAGQGAGAASTPAAAPGARTAATRGAMPSGAPTAAPVPGFGDRLTAAQADAWTVETDLRLAGFDPGDWIPAAAGSVWRVRPSRLTGEVRGRLLWPEHRLERTGRAEADAQRLARLTGDATLRLDAGSNLLGVAVRADSRWTRATGAEPLRFEGQAEAAGNRLRAEGSIDPAVWAAGPAGAGTALNPSPDGADRLQLAIEADALDALRPWWQALSPGQSAAEPAPGGRVRLELAASGHWPRVRAEGRLQADALRWGRSSVTRAEGRLRAGAQAGEPILVELTVQSARHAGQTLDRGRLRLDGSLADHRLEAEVLARAVPPAALRLLGTAEPQARPDERSLWTVSGRGGWAEADAAPAASGPAPAGRPAATGALRAGPQTRPSERPTTAGLHPALAAWLDGRPTRWTMQALQARVAPTRAGGAGPAAVSAAGGASPAALPAEWLGAEAESVLVDVPGRGADGSPATGSTASAAAAWALRLGPGALRSAAATVRWDRLAWQQSLPGRAGAFEADARLEPVAIAPLLQRLQPGFGWGGDLIIGGRLEARSGDDPARDLRLDLRVDRQGGDLFVQDGSLRQPLGLSDLHLAARARDGVWNLDLGAVGSRLGRLVGQATLPSAADSPWPGADSPLRGRIVTQVADLGVWGAWVPTGWRLGGQLRGEVDLGGTLAQRRFEGELRGDALSVRNPLQGVAVTDGLLRIRLRGDRAEIETAQARAGGGTIAITGGTALVPGAPVTDLVVVADRFQLLGRVDRRILASGRGRVQLGPRLLAVDGRFQVDEGLIDFSRRDAPTLSDDVVIDGEAPPDETGEASAGSGSAADPRMQLALDLQIDLGERLRVRGRGLDAGLRGLLRITSPGNKLALNGTVRAVDGTYAAYGQRLAITRGNVVFSGAADNPRLDIQATRPNLDVVVGVSIVGPVAAPRVRLFSEPEMSETEKLSWLVLGRGSDGLGRTDAALLQRAAFALLAGEDGGSQDPISALLGLDSLSISQTDGENSRDTVLSLGKQLNRRWYVGYERSLNAATGSFQLIYRLAQRFTLRAQSGEDNSLDLIWTWRWQ